MTQTIVDRLAAEFEVTLVRQILRGGMKEVAIADDEGSEVVIKAISIDSPATLERAKREFSTLEAAEESDHVVSLMSDLFVDPEGDLVGWLEEYVPGEDLTDALTASPWDWSRARRLGLQVSSGLSWMHDLHIVHRDLSPNNVRVTPNDDFVVMDPGLSRHSELTSLTGALVVGTPGWMTPEHVGAHSPTAASDVYAIGLLMYRVLAGQPAIAWTGDPAAYVQALRGGQFPALDSFRSDLPPDGVALVQRCLDRHAARRPPNAKTMHDLLEAIQ